MRIYSSIALAGAVGLSGCSGASLLSGGTQSAALGNVDLSHYQAVPGDAGRLIGRAPRAHPGHSWVHPSPDTKSGCIYLSDNISEVVNIYSAKSPYAQFGTLSSPSNYGWGVAANRKTVYVGTYADTIEEYTPCSATKLGTILTGSSGGDPYGLAADDAGDVYATVFPSSTVDIWSPLGNHTTGTDSLQGAIFFIDLSKNDKHVYLSGAVGSDTQTVDRCGPAITGTCKTVVTIQGGFPGGVQIDNKNNLYVNDQNGTLYSYTCVGAKCTATGSFTYSAGQPPFHYTAIALDRRAKNLWAANFWGCAFLTNCADAQSQSLPLSSAMFNGATMPDWEYATPLGVAIWRPD
jgi:hypothetical protein